MLNYNSLLPNAAEIKLLFDQDRLSSKVRSVSEYEYKDFEEYRYKRARSYFTRGERLSYHSSLKSRDMQLVGRYLRNKRKQKTKLTMIDIAIIEWAVGIMSKEELENILMSQPTP